jgi:SAM-dependent methyltransferase
MSLPKTAEFFDAYARDFDAIYGTRNGLVNNTINRLFRKCMKERYLLTIEGCSPVEGRTVLDVGCGPGHYSIELARRGAAKVVGIDFADKMLDIAREDAGRRGLSGVRFERMDFVAADFPQPFDYVIAMGFMDYIRDARSVVEKALQLTTRKAFFSFPMDGGLLAMQRRIRYRFRCDLFLYREADVRRLFQGFDGVRLEVKDLGRDLFVTAHKA